MLDVMLLWMDGLEVCWCLCVKGEMVLIIMLIVKFEEIDKVFGFEFGVDDYIIKLFLMCEFCLCVKVVLRCLGMVCVDVDDECLIDVCGLCIDFGKCMVLCNGDMI